MLYRNLKSTGLKVSAFCLGTMTFGGQTSEEESRKIIDFALDNGVNFIDTANIYTRGESESILGRTLGARRRDVVLATKVGGPVGKLPNESGLNRRLIIRAVDESLTRLKTDYIDLYYMHFPDTGTPAQEYLETMSMLVRSGKIRYYGVSNFSAWQCCALIHKAKEMGAVPPVVTQNVYNLLTRGVEDEFVPFLEEYKMGLAVFNPLAGGLLTGKHRREQFTQGTRFDLERGYADRYWSEKNFDAIDVLKEAAKDAEMTMIELSYQWLLGKACVDSVICGVSKLAQAEENVSYFREKRLSEGVVEKCDGAWELLKGSYFNYHR